MNKKQQKSAKELVSAAFLIIGDEILSGRTCDKNLHFLAQNLTEIGINLGEVRVVADKREAIIAAVTELRKKFDYLFTSGGIGPTHDDITSEAIAAAFGVEIKENKIAKQILLKFYGEKVNEAQLKMARIPCGAELLDNPVSSAPGFRIENVLVMAGVPKIFQAMFFAAKKDLVVGKKIKSFEIKIALVESKIANDLTQAQALYRQVAIGSYPFEGGTSVVCRSSNLQMLDECVARLTKIISEFDIEGKKI